MVQLQHLTEALGYTFQNEQLLRLALRHPSLGAQNNQRLEFLGDAVLQLLISHKLYQEYPNLHEGAMTRLRQRLVCEQALADIAQKIDLGAYMAMDHGSEMSGVRTQSGPHSDAMEAVLAAVYLDGGMNEATRIVRRFWPRPEDVKMPMQDSKNVLQERLQAQGGDPPAYVITGQSGPAHSPMFHATVSRNGKILGTGSGKSKKEAEKAAALDALARLDQAGNA